MRLSSYIIGSAAFAALALGSTAKAAEPQYGVTSEFLSVCDDFNSSEHAAQNLLNASWSEAGKAHQEALSPDDLLKRVKRVRAFTVELDNGGEWFAATAEGKMGGEKVAYCSVTAFDEDPDGYRQDFEMASGLKPTNSVSHEIEERKIYTAPNNTIYVMREVRVPEKGMFTFIKLAPISAKGK